MCYSIHNINEVRQKVTSQIGGAERRGVTKLCLVAAPATCGSTNGQSNPTQPAIWEGDTVQFLVRRVAKSRKGGGYCC